MLLSSPQCLHILAFLGYTPSLWSYISQNIFEGLHRLILTQRLSHWRACQALYAKYGCPTPHMVLWFLCCLENQISGNRNSGAEASQWCQWWGTAVLGWTKDYQTPDCIQETAGRAQHCSCIDVASNSKLKAGVMSTFPHDWGPGLPDTTSEW